MRQHVRLILSASLLRRISEGNTRPMLPRNVGGEEVIITIESSSWSKKYPEETEAFSEWLEGDD